MGSLLTCGVIDRYIIFGIIPAFAIFLYKIIVGNIRITKYPLLLCICSSLSICLSIIPFLILKKRSKRKPIEHQKIMGEAFKKYKTKRCKRFIYLIISTILDCIQTLLTCLYLLEQYSNKWAFDVIILNLISYYLLNIKLYKHHYLCIFIIIISGISLNIVYFINFNDTFINVLIDYGKELALCFSFCINKYIMENNYTTPYEICFYIGFFGLFIYLIFFGIIMYIDNKYLDECIEYYNNFDYKELFLLFAFIFLHFIYNLCICISIKRYNPIYNITVLIFHEVCYSLEDVENWKFYINIILAIIFTFVFLIYNEIIEINCCGLEKNTKKNIRKRAQIDAVKNDNYYDNNERYESLTEIDGFPIELENIGLEDESPSILIII